jgi:quinoprotein glucose dehydrogenase
MTTRRSRPGIRAFALLGLVLCTASAAPPGRQAEDDEPQWGSYGGDPGGNRHSPLTQIDRTNVGRLKIAWTYRTGELGAGFARADTLTFEATPILVRDTLYLSTATNIVIALDPATGAQRWRYDPRIDRARRYSEATSRGGRSRKESCQFSERTRLSISTPDMPEA